MKTKQEAIEIRRIYSETGGNVSETARQCGCGRDTVRRALVRDYSINDGRKHRYHSHDEDRMIESVILSNAQDAARSKKLRLTATRIAHIVQDEGCRLSERQLLKRVSVVRRRLSEKPGECAFLELDAPMGAFQCDYGTVESYIGDERVSVHILILSSAFSNAFACTACQAEDSANFFEGLERCFGQLGGVPPVIRFDNLSPAIAWNKSRRQMTEPFSRFVVHHGFKAEFCNPCSGWEKGNVENKVKYVRNNFFNPVCRCRYDSIDALNNALYALAIEDRKRKHYKKHRSIASLFDAEMECLLSFKNPFGYMETRVACVDKQGFVHYRGNRYFSKHSLACGTILIKADSKHVQLFGSDLKPIVTHKRAYGKDRRVQTANDLAVMLSRKPGAIPYVIQPKEEAEALRRACIGVRSVERVDMILDVLTKQSNVQKLHFADDSRLEKYDTLAGLNERSRGYFTDLHTPKAGINDSRNGAKTG